jgi:hypothetical protein
MSVVVSGDIIRISGNASVADAEPILAALHQDPSRRIDLREAGHLHSAVVQILLAVRPRITGGPSYPFFSAYVLPQFDQE